jgi:Leucine-rich repeat (LRR) protein
MQHLQKTASPSNKAAQMKRKISAFLLAMLLVGAVHAQNQRSFNINHTLSPRQATGTASTERVPREAERYRPFDYNRQLHDFTPANVGDTLLLHLFDDKHYRAVVERVGRSYDGITGITAKLLDTDFGYCYLSLSAQGISLSVDVPQADEQFRVATKEGRAYLWQAKLSDVKKDELGCADIELPEEDALQLQATPLSGDGTAEVNADNINDAVTIDLLIVYTANAATWAAQNATSIDHVINQAMQRSNTIMANSLTNITFNLVYKYATTYTEVPNSTNNEDLYRLMNTNDGHLDEVHELRRLYHADLVMLIPQINYTGGVAYLLNSVTGTPTYGFGLSRVQQTATTETMVHEIGHNMGCGHHWQQLTQPGPGLFPYSSGYRGQNTQNKWYSTVMTYAEATYFADGHNAPRIPFFSDPDIAYGGVHIGDTELANNALTLRQTKHAIARYSDYYHPALSSLSVNRGALSPAFDTDILNYTVTLPAGVNDITIAATPFHIRGSVSGTGYQLLHEGDNTFQVITTAAAGLASQTYTIVVHCFGNGSSLVFDWTADGDKDFTLCATAGEPFTVNWGDGQPATTYTGAGTGTDVVPAHTYGASGNYQVTVTGNTAACTFTRLDVAGRSVGALEVSKATGLLSLDGSNNRLKSLDVSKNTALQALSCYTNVIPLVDLYAASQRIADVNNKRLGRQTLPSVKISMNTPVVLDSVFNGIGTSFAVDFSGGNASGHYSLSGGTMTFTSPGTFTVTITHPAITSHASYPAEVVATCQVFDGIPLPYTTGFAGSLDGWTSHSTAGNKNWIWSDNTATTLLQLNSTTAGNGYAAFYALNLPDDDGPNPAAGELRSLIFDFSGEAGKAIHMTFEYAAGGYEDQSTTLSVLVSTDEFTGSDTVWRLPSIGSRLLGTAVIDLSAYAGQPSVSIALAYDGGKAYGWLVDDMAITATSSPTGDWEALSFLWTGTTSNKNFAVRATSGEPFTVHWGDGQASSYTGTNLDIVPAHSYTTSGAYRVTVTGNTAACSFTRLNVPGRAIGALDVSKATSLLYLSCGANQLMNLDVSKNTALTNLYCESNQLTTLDISKNTALTNFGCENNRLTTLDVSKNTELVTLWCVNNLLTTLDLSNNTALLDLYCYNNLLTTLDLSQNTALTTLYCDNNRLTTLDVSKNTGLLTLWCYNNRLTTLDLSQNTALTTLYGYNNQLMSLDVSQNTALQTLRCYTNAIPLVDLYAASQRIATANSKYLGTQTLPPVTVAINAPVVVDSVFNGNNTTFAVDFSGGNATGNYSLSGGTITFTASGTFTVTITNPAIASHASYPAKVIATYNVASCDASLSSLTVNGAPATLQSGSTYTASVANNMTEVTIAASATHPAATVSGDVGIQSVSVGNNPFTITVTAEDGTTQKTYTLLITRENAPLTFTGFTLNQGASVAVYRTVDLCYTFSGGVPTHFMAGERADLSDAVWKAYTPAAATYSFASDEHGVKTVYTKLKNDFGETEIKSDAITYKPLHAKLSLTYFGVNGHTERTTQRAVTLQHTVANGTPTHYSVSEDRRQAGLEWHPYTLAPVYTLSEGTGPKEVFFVVANDTDTSEVVSDQIYLDASETLESHGLMATLYPNPVSSDLNVEIDGSGETAVQVTIYTLTGEIYLSQTYHSRSFRLDLSRYPSGALLVKLTEGKNYVVKRIIKN